MSPPTPQQVFESLTKGLPRFDDGRINFTGVRKAPVLSVVVYHDGKILIVKRSHKVSAYQGPWNVISGFIDELKPLEEFAIQELSEELSIGQAAITTIQLATPYEVRDKSIDRVWVVYPILAQLIQKPNIVLDWEHTDFAWITPEQLKNYTYVKDVDVSVAKALALVT